MTFNIAICDDEPLFLVQLKKCLETFQFSKNMDFSICSFDNASDLLLSHTKNPFDVFFLDIEISSTNGIELAKNIRDISTNNPYIIFVTSYPEYMHDSFDVQPFQYILKPYGYENISETLNSIIDHINKNHITKLIINTDSDKHLIYVQDILYIHTYKKSYIEYVLSDSTYISRENLSYVENELKPYGFLSPCRGYIVNILHIKNFNNSRLIVDNGHSIDISRRHLKDFQDNFSKKIMEMLK